ncbi:D-alanyl-D-alanine carboxypeptidase [Pontibaca sp. S1109L]|uniref:D-alanyl-D-alanine carboxypeptidase n=2 Tax=Pontibaca salina TaxID=2795731 RepID=A0A934HT30_9RHOB|nr:D-alanyl-D-alanine carboxypeptidase [Pontibaca salina]
MAAPYAAYVIDARTGEVLHSANAETRLHPASLTKMMTLYIAFEAVQNGEISLDDRVTISRKAAAEPPSKLGLKSGQRIALRYLIRAAAVRSANDAATAIGEAISGSEAAFAARMNRTAKMMGMTQTTFKNAHGLTQSGHLSTARDMTILGRHVLYDYPQYYNLFSRRTADAGIRKVSHTNRRLLSSYAGADGIKTGYTNAAGFNLVASAERGGKRVIATVFGGKSTASRNAKVAELLDLGFRRSPNRAPVQKPNRPAYVGNTATPGPAGKTIRVVSAVQKSPRPQMRADQEPVLMAIAAAAAAAQDEAIIKAAISEGLDVAMGSVDESVPDRRPAARPENLVLAFAEPAVAATEPDPPQLNAPQHEAQQEIVTRVSTSGGQHWGINVGRYGSRYQAERVLLRTALAEMTTLEGTLRKVVQSPRGFDANFMGMSRDTADLACRRLQARNVSCFMIGPS